MTDVVLAVDQGTSSTRCFVIDSNLDVLGVASRPVRSSFPGPGWVEQDPEELIGSTIESIGEAVDRARVPWGSVRGIGIDNQTETFVVWDRDSSEAVYPAIVWQCRRTADACEDLRAEGHEPMIRERTGLELDPSFSATKLAWVLEHVDGARKRAEAGELAFGDVASWLIWRLSGGSRHVTEPSNASRSMLLNLETLEWDPELMALFDVPPDLLPAIQPSGSVLAETSEETVGAGVPIAGALGDQQAALFGQQCWHPGMAKVTLGTGAFLWANAGLSAPSPPDGILATCAWQLEEETSYAFEGFVPVAGAVVSWMVESGLLDDPGASDAMVAELSDDDEIVFVPALTGLGAPTWDASARGAILGITRATTSGHIVRAALDGVAHQVADAVEAMESGIKGGFDLLRADGGMSRNDWLMQRLADLASHPVERPANPEATGVGVAAIAGLTTGLWSSRDELAERWKLDRRFDPGMPAETRSRHRNSWGEAVRLARSWP